MLEYKNTGFLEPDNFEKKFTGEWYYDDEKLTDLYQALDNEVGGENSVDSNALENLYSEVQNQIANLQSRTDATIEEKQNIEKLYNVSKVLFSYKNPLASSEIRISEKEAETDSDILPSNDLVN